MRPFKFAMDFDQRSVEKIVLAYLEELLPKFDGHPDRDLAKDGKAIKRVIKVVEA